MNYKYLLISAIGAASAIFISGCFKQKFKPGTPLASVELVKVVIDDSKDGNGDGKLNPGETVNLFLTLKNTGKRALRASKAVLFTNQSGIRVIEQTTEFSAMKSGQQATSSTAFAVAVDSNVTATSAAFYLEAFSGADIGVTFPVEILGTLRASAAQGTAIKVVSIAIADSLFGNNDGELDPTERVRLCYKVRNTGSLPFPASEGILRSLQPGVSVLDSTAAFPPIPVGMDVSSSECFEIFVDASVVADSVKMLLILNDKATGLTASDLHLLNIEYKVYPCVKDTELIVGAFGQPDILLVSMSLCNRSYRATRPPEAVIGIKMALQIIRNSIVVCETEQRPNNLQPVSEPVPGGQPNIDLDLLLYDTSTGYGCFDPVNCAGNPLPRVQEFRFQFDKGRVFTSSCIQFQAEILVNADRIIPDCTISLCNAVKLARTYDIYVRLED